MKLSEAIRQGSTMIRPKAGAQYFQVEKAGCALGMAAVARGCTFGPAKHPVPPSERRTLNAEMVWGDWILEVMERPCTCWRCTVPRRMRVKDIVAHLFDHHVEGRRDWNLAQLMAWVETVEPAEIVQPSRSTAEIRPFGSLPPEEIDAVMQEIKNWQAVRDGFLARQKTTRRAGEKRLPLALPAQPLRFEEARDAKTVQH